MATLVILTVIAIFLWRTRSWTEVPADFQHPSELAPDECYDDSDELEDE